MNSKSRHNQASESRLMDESLIEQRAVQIARDEGRETPSPEDRARSREELLAPNETQGDPEISPELGQDITAWVEAPGDRGHKVADSIPDDENSIGKDLVEKGMRGPVRTTPLGEDPFGNK